MGKFHFVRASEMITASQKISNSYSSMETKSYQGVDSSTRNFNNKESSFLFFWGGWGGHTPNCSML